MSSGGLSAGIFSGLFAGVLLMVGAGGAASKLNSRAQVPSGTNRNTALGSEGTLPKDVFPDSRNRLPRIKREDLDERGRKTYDDAVAASATGSAAPEGVAEIRLHGSGVDVRWASPLGRRLTELAILATARERDQPYEWSLHATVAISAIVGCSSLRRDYDAMEFEVKNT